ncbi:hypothetical protein BT69DRAFT_1359257 [Atractiella rhizophila]|nr:hypothetical protein BT69DRAFT_1359257 [Atractiella rhizophila]
MELENGERVWCRRLHFPIPHPSRNHCRRTITYLVGPRLVKEGKVGVSPWVAGER